MFNVNRHLLLCFQIQIKRTFVRRWTLTARPAFMAAIFAAVPASAAARIAAKSKTHNQIIFQVILIAGFSRNLSPFWFFTNVVFVLNFS